MNVEVISILDLNKVDIFLYDAFVLSGSSKYAILNHLDVYSSEIELIKKSNKPILGICLGFELICYTFDEKLIFHKEQYLPLNSAFTQIFESQYIVNLPQKFQFTHPLKFL